VVAARTEVDVAAEPAFARYAAGTIHETARMIHERGGTAVGIPCDVSRVEDIRRLVAATLERFGRLDVVVNNAGIDCEAPVVDRALPASVRDIGVYLSLQS
jgi:NAD(P)-dependent dehydrogenase (short-subunit alcohol dehydrogenase family)